MAFEQFGTVITGEDKFTSVFESFKYGASEMGMSVSKLSTLFNKVSLSGAVAVAAFVGLGMQMKSAVVEASKFEMGMAEVQTILGKEATPVVNAYGEALKKMTVGVPQDINTLTSSLYDIVSASFRGEQALEVLDASARAASAGLTDTATASKAIVAALNVYGHTAYTAAEVSDIMFMTVKRGVLRFEELASTIGVVLPIARNANVTLEEVGGALMTMTRGGLDASRSSIYLRQTLMSVIKASEQTKEYARSLGMEFSTSAIKSQGLANWMDQLYKATGGNIDVMAKLFKNTRALTGALALAGAGAEGLTKDIEYASNATGASGEAFEIVASKFANRVKLMKNAFKVFLILVGKDALESFAGLVKFITNAIRTLIQFEKDTHLVSATFKVFATVISVVVWGATAAFMGFAKIFDLSFAQPIRQAAAFMGAFSSASGNLWDKIKAGASAFKEGGNFISGYSSDVLKAAGDTGEFADVTRDMTELEALVAKALGVTGEETEEVAKKTSDAVDAKTRYVEENKKAIKQMELEADLMKAKLQLEEDLIAADVKIAETKASMTEAVIAAEADLAEARIEAAQDVGTETAAFKTIIGETQTDWATLIENVGTAFDDSVEMVKGWSTDVLEKSSEAKTAIGTLNEPIEGVVGGFDAFRNTTLPDWLDVVEDTNEKAVLAAQMYSAELEAASTILSDQMGLQQTLLEIDVQVAGKKIELIETVIEAEKELALARMSASKELDTESAQFNRTLQQSHVNWGKLITSVGTSFDETTESVKGWSTDVLEGMSGLGDTVAQQMIALRTGFDAMAKSGRDWGDDVEDAEERVAMALKTYKEELEATVKLVTAAMKLESDLAKFALEEKKALIHFQEVVVEAQAKLNIQKWQTFAETSKAVAESIGQLVEFFKALQAPGAIMFEKREVMEKITRLADAQAENLELQNQNLRAQNDLVERQMSGEPFTMKFRVEGDTSGWLAGLLEDLLNKAQIEATAEGVSCCLIAAEAA